MKTLHPAFIPSVAAVVLAVALCGCRSVCRPRFDISPAAVREAVRGVDGGPYAVVEVRRLSFPEFACNMTSRKNYPCRETVPGSRIMPELERLFPGVFADTPDAVPVIVMQEVRSGGVTSGSTLELFDGASGFNKNLSRLDRSDMTAEEGFSLPFSCVNAVASICTLGLVPVHLGTFSSHYGVSIMTGYDTYGGKVAYSAGTGWWMLNALAAAAFPESAGWRHEVVEANVPVGTPDATEAQKQTALCCAIARALAELSPEERAALRRNPVALLRDKETGGGRAFRLVQVAPERESAEVRLGDRPDRPRILSQAYDPTTRRGSVVFDPSGCADAKAAVAWVRDVYIPLVASQKAVALGGTAASGPGVPPARPAITGFRREAQGACRIDFAVPE